MSLTSVMKEKKMIKGKTNKQTKKTPTHTKQKPKAKPFLTTIHTEVMIDNLRQRFRIFLTSNWELHSVYTWT